MSLQSILFRCSCMTVLLCAFVNPLSAEILRDPFREAEYTPWKADEAVQLEFNEQLYTDSAVEQTQMLTPQRTPSARTARLPSRSMGSRRNRSLASVPFMIGDTTAGSCVTFGGVTDVELGHPTLGCSRLNISEGNTPLPTDRVYFSYRHFENASLARAFANVEQFNIDRFTVAGERTFFDGMLSTEIRVPLESRLTSDIRTNIVQFDPPTLPAFTPGIEPFIGGREVELANMSMIFKALLIERRDFALSAGLGVTLPTAQDVTYDATFDTFVGDGVTVDALHVAQIKAVASNETIYLAPYLAWLSQPTKKFFHQGFLQVEVAANPSRIHTDAGGFWVFDTNLDNAFTPFVDATLGFATPFSAIAAAGTGLATGEVQPQTIMRLNLGFGYELYANRQADWIQKLTGIFEVHYTGTLSDANLNQVPLNLFLNGVQVPPDDPIFDDPTFDDLNNITIGNRANQIHIVNLTAGVSANVGNLVVTHGFTAPITDSQNRGFDFEYNLQIQRPF